MSFFPFQICMPIHQNINLKTTFYQNQFREYKILLYNWGIIKISNNGDNNIKNDKSDSTPGKRCCINTT